jgi:hypothetical protein
MRRGPLIVVSVAIGLLVEAAGSPPAWAGDGPPGFWWGTDSNAPAPSGSASPCASSSAPWLEPNVYRKGCGRYGGYLGELGGYWTILGCGFSNAWNSTAAGRADKNLTSYRYGVGTVAYWFGGGPGTDPIYDGTRTEAFAWGRRQAKKAWSLWRQNTQVSARLLVLDVEDGGTQGWNEKMRSGSCTQVKSTSACCSPSVDRATVGGFLGYLRNHTTLFGALYSSNGEWTHIFGTGVASRVSHIEEWTADWGQDCVNPGPYQWKQAAGRCPSNQPSFFGGLNSSSECAIAWQWSGGSKDYDQIDRNRFRLCP